MNYEEAKAELRRVINEQQTVSTPKLSRLIQAMNIPLRPGKEFQDPEIQYLKGQIRKMKKEMRS